MARTTKSNHTIQQLEDASVHDWYRFALAYPDHLVANVLEKFGVGRDQTVLDPFAGTGTTLVECKKRGISSVGIDANPMAAFASRVKTTWNVDLAEFDRCRSDLLNSLREPLQAMGADYPFQYSFADLISTESLARDRGDAQEIPALLPKGWISETPLRKILLIEEAINALPDGSISDLFKLALASVVVNDASNLGFGPEVHVAKNRQDADVYGAFAEKLRNIRDDLATVQQIAEPGKTTVYCGDARQLGTLVHEPIHFVITSPPYPNEKDYTRTTRLELVLMGFIQEKGDLRQVKEAMLRSHTRNVFVADDDSAYVSDIPEIQAVAQETESKRLERGATSGFERLYHRVMT